MQFAGCCIATWCSAHHPRRTWAAPLEALSPNGTLFPGCTVLLLSGAASPPPRPSAPSAVRVPPLKRAWRTRPCLHSTHDAAGFSSTHPKGSNRAVLVHIGPTPVSPSESARRGGVSIVRRWLSELRAVYGGGGEFGCELWVWCERMSVGTGTYADDEARWLDMHAGRLFGCGRATHGSLPRAVSGKPIREGALVRARQSGHARDLASTHIPHWTPISSRPGRLGLSGTLHRPRARGTPLIVLRCSSAARCRQELLVCGLGEGV